MENVTDTVVLLAGTSGSGKTTAMKDEHGILRALAQTMEQFQTNLYMSYLEVTFESTANGKTSSHVRDLLGRVEGNRLRGLDVPNNPVTLEMRGGKVVHDARVFHLASPQQLLDLYHAGEERAHVAVTKKNAGSSRSQKLLICVSTASPSPFRMR